MVQENYKVFNLAASLLHPLAVWDAICCGGASFSQLNSGLPTHFQAELHGIVDALHSSYSTVALVVLEAAKLLLEVRQTEESVARGHAEFSAAVTESQLTAAESGACTAAGAGEEATAAAAAAAAVAAEAKENVVIAAAMEAAALPLTSSFVKALQYVCAKQIVTAPPMFLLSSTSATAQDDSWQLACKVASRIAQAPLGAGQLRHLLMDCVRPGVDGCLPGYTPSPNFSQVTPPVFVCL